MTATVINKKILSDILKEVIFPFYAKLKSDDRISRYIMDDEVAYRLKHKQTMLSYYFLTCPVNDECFKEKFISAGKIHEKINLDPGLLDEYGTFMFGLYEQWIAKHLNPSDTQSVKWKEKLTLAQKYLLSEYSPVDFHEDEFFTFESEDVDESINKMHYEEKIDAAFYMTSQEIDSLEIDELCEICDDYDTMVAQHEVLDDILLEKSLNLFEEFARFYERSYEFKDIGYGIRELIVYLRQLKLSSLDSMQLEMLYMYINAIGRELNNWKDSILIYQDAQDIHYLDASLLANITQLKMMLQGEGAREDLPEEEEFELF